MIYAAYTIKRENKGKHKVQLYLRHPGWKCRRGCACLCSLHQTSQRRRCGCGWLAGWDWEEPRRGCWSNPGAKVRPRPGSALPAGPGGEVAAWGVPSSLWRIGVNSKRLWSAHCHSLAVLQHDKQEESAEQAVTASDVTTPRQTLQPTRRHMSDGSLSTCWNTPICQRTIQKKITFKPVQLVYFSFGIWSVHTQTLDHVW